MPPDPIIDMIRHWIAENTGVRFDAEVPALHTLADRVREQCAKENREQSPAWIDERVRLEDEISHLRTGEA
ncbi:MAG TPA: hypothetical protein VGU45_02150 [Microvirga sp.]|jgi:3-phenylpropionate/cinnamic acid dioxygenase small subunit|nr:hypothetical protein [Microvirga sp.]